LWAEQSGLPRLAVQHHHAHVAACLAEHGRTGPALGVAFDGTGAGVDGQVWGGEILEADLASFVRRGHLRPIALAGGEAAIRQPWRLALAALLDAGESDELVADVPRAQRRRVEALLDARTVRSSAAGRWFDAVAALCGLAREVSYDGQAPCELEAIAAGAQAAYPFEIAEPGGGAPFTLDLRPCIRAIASDRRACRPVPAISAGFHETLAQAILAACLRARGAGAPGLVTLVGGCFCNRRLAERARALLLDAGFEVLLPERVPAGDGGLALGQAAVASYLLTRGRKEANGTCV
jgi:hydrogenase maturation protein HypF